MLKPGRRAQVIGFVDALHGSSIHGWAADAKALDDILDVTILANGQTIGQGHADQYRADLAAAGYGHGKHGFVITLAEGWRSAASFSVVAGRAVDKREGTPLPQSAGVGAQIARAHYSALETIEPPASIVDICKRVSEGSFSAPPGVPSEIERVYLSDELLAKTILAVVERA